MKSRSVGIFLIASACVVSFALGLEANSAEANASATVLPPPAISIERSGDKVVAIHIHNEKGEHVVTLYPDGSVKSEAEPTEAAATMWAALSSYIRSCSKL